MSVKENKTIVRRVIEVWNEGNYDVWDEVYATDFVNHDPNAPDVYDREGLKQFAIAMKTGFPDLRAVIEDMVAEGDEVAKRFISRGTHTGEYMGIPPTGKEVTIKGTTIYRVSEGKVEECWWSYDALGMMQQLGVIPAAG